MADIPTPKASPPSSPAVPEAGTADVDRALALRDVMDHVVESSKTAAPPRQTQKRRAITIVVCVLLLAVSAFSWIARPERIWGPSGEAVSPVLDRASARLSMYIVAQRLNDVRERTGSYPRTLADVGESGNGISYSLVGDSLFILSAAALGEGVEYRSDQPLDEFLGRSVDLIATRPR